ncbi:MAG: CDP-alcohol phosphatidyltransferase family protein [Elusimicrobiota bacterium]
MADKTTLPTLRDIRDAHAWKNDYERFLPASRFVFRPVGFLATWLGIRLGLTSEAVSWLSGLAAALGYFFLLGAQNCLLPLGIALLCLFNLLDCVDGSIARVMQTQNPYGRFLDSLMAWVDMGFWAVLGIMLYRHPHLAHWPEPFGRGAIYWVALGTLTALLCSYIAYTEQIFDSLLREEWNKLPGTPKPDISGHVPQKGDPLALIKLNASRISHNLRVRETHYLLLIPAYVLRCVDVLLTFFLCYYVLYLLLIVVTYCRRGGRIRDLRRS